MHSADQFAAALKAEAVASLQQGLAKIEHCFGQLTTEQLWWRPTREMNAIGNLVLHLGGNLGQWIVAGVGDNPDRRDRPREFAERGEIPGDELLTGLKSVLASCDGVIRELTAEQLFEQRTVQGWDVSKLQALLHAVIHFQGHVQEIISLTRQQLGKEYRFHWQPSTPEQGARP